MKRARSKPNFPFDVLGKDGVAAGRELSVAKCPAQLHDDLIGFLRANSDCEVELVPKTPGPYLSFPVIDESSRTEMAKRMSALRIPAKDVDYALCGLCEPICVAQVKQFLETGTGADLSQWAKLPPVAQLEAALAPCEAAGIGLAPCHLGKGKAADAFIKLWSSIEGTKTLADFKHVSKIEQLLVGHPEFFGVELLKAEQHFAVPFYVVNYLQDEMRHELHVVGAVLREGRKLTIIDPNGVCPEDFGEPNAIMLALPWKKRK